MFTVGHVSLCAAMSPDHLRFSDWSMASTWLPHGAHMASSVCLYASMSESAQNTMLWRGVVAELWIVKRVSMEPLLCCWTNVESCDAECDFVAAVCLHVVVRCCTAEETRVDVGSVVWCIWNSGVGGHTFFQCTYSLRHSNKLALGGKAKAEATY